MFLKKLIERTYITNTKKYIKYAVGEILLLVIGILIALQINNWNEHRKAEIELNSVLKSIAIDLESDIKESEILIDYYKHKMNLLDTLFNDTLGIDFLTNKSVSIGINTNYNDLTINTRGYSQLLSLKSNPMVAEDTLVSQISNFYTSYQTRNEDISVMIKASTSNTLEYYRDKFDWYFDFIKGRASDDIIREVYADTKARNNIVHYGMLVGGNYMRLLSTFNIDCKEQLKSINTRIK